MNTTTDIVAEVLRNFGTKERFIGVVDHYENTTLWIRSNGKFYFAFTSEALGFQPGAPVSFRKDGSMRAKDIIKVEQPEHHGSA